MIEGIVVGVIIAIATILINALVRRTGVQTRSDRMEEDLMELKKGQQMTFQVLLPLVLSVKGQKPNGELERALELLNDYLIKK